VRAVPPGSAAELSCQKIVFDLQLADLAVQEVDLCLIDGCLRRSASLEEARCTVQQLLLPVIDLVRVNPEFPRQLGDGPVAFIAANATFALNAALCFFRVCFMSCSRAIRAF
jgi:hypothetical protein